METLDKVALLNLAIQLDDVSLANFCSTNRRMKDFCLNANILWQERLKKYLGKYYEKFGEGDAIDVMNKYRSKYKMSWKDYYISTMTELDDIFIKLQLHEKDKREDVQKLIRIMRNEPFTIYDKNLYENTPIDEVIYNSLTKDEKRWISKEVMIFHILNGNIKQQKNIEEILSKGISDGVVDVVNNSLDSKLDVDGILHIINYLDFLIENDNFLTALIMSNQFTKKQYRKFLKVTRKNLKKALKRIR